MSPHPARCESSSRERACVWRCHEGGVTCGALPPAEAAAGITTTIAAAPRPVVVCACGWCLARLCMRYALRACASFLLCESAVLGVSGCTFELAGSCVLVEFVRFPNVRCSLGTAPLLLIQEEEEEVGRAQAITRANPPTPPCPRECVRRKQTLRPYILCCGLLDIC